MTGRYSIPFCKKDFLYLLTLAPSDGSAATLAKAKRLTHFYSVASLLEKRFACFPCPGTAFDLHFIVSW